MGRRGHATRRSLRHAEAVRTRDVVERDEAQATMHVGRELPVQVVQRDTAGAHCAGHGTGAVRVPVALRVRGQRRVRSRERRRRLRDRLHCASGHGHHRATQRVPVRSRRCQEPRLPVPAACRARLSDAAGDAERVVWRQRVHGRRVQDGDRQVPMPGRGAKTNGARGVLAHRENRTRLFLSRLYGGRARHATGHVRHLFRRSRASLPRARARRHRGLC